MSIHCWACLPSCLYGISPHFAFTSVSTKSAMAFNWVELLAWQMMKKIGHGFGYLAEVEAYDLIPLFLLYGMNDGFEDFAVSR